MPSLEVQPGHVVGWAKVFFFEVLQIEKNASITDHTTVVIVRAITLFHIFRDLYMDVKWTGVGRRLAQPAPWVINRTLPSISYNLDSQGNVQDRFIDMGPVRCENCSALMGSTLTFQLRTDGAVPKYTSFRLDADLNVSMKVGLSPQGQSWVMDLWNRIKQYSGPELLSLAAAGATSSGALLPLFSAVTSTLKVELKPVFAMDMLTQALQDMVMNGRLTFDLNTIPSTAFFELSWDSTSGMKMNTSFDYATNIGLTGTTLSRNFTVGMRTCVGLQLNVLSSTPLTTLEVCPEVKTFVQKLATRAVPHHPPQLERTAVIPDAELCFEFNSFTTDGDNDPLTPDEPYAEGCFLGRCVATSYDKRFGFTSNTVNWENGNLCLPVRKHDLDSLDITLHVHEKDVLYDDMYTLPYVVRLNSTKCPQRDAGGCLLDEALPPKVGTFARISVKVFSRALQSPRRLQGQECSGTAVVVSLGVSGSFGGFSYPSTFSKGANDQAVHSGGPMPSTRPVSPKTTCLSDQGQGQAASGTSRASTTFVFALFWMCIWSREVYCMRSAQ